MLDVRECHDLHVQPDPIVHQLIHDRAMAQAVPPGARTLPDDHQ
jgi:hypothetical protein